MGKKGDEKGLDRGRILNSSDDRHSFISVESVSSNSGSNFLRRTNCSFVSHRFSEQFCWTRFGNSSLFNRLLACLISCHVFESITSCGGMLVELEVSGSVNKG